MRYQFTFTDDDYFRLKPFEILDPVRLFLIISRLLYFALLSTTRNILVPCSVEPNGSFSVVKFIGGSAAGPNGPFSMVKYQ